MTEPRAPGFYRDITNGDMWRLDVVDGREQWTWVNGNAWRFVPETLERIEYAN